MEPGMRPHEKAQTRTPHSTEGSQTRIIEQRRLRRAPHPDEIDCAAAARKKGRQVVIDIAQWSQTLLEKLDAHFGERLVFAGIQGSRARGEGGDESDIDFVAVFDTLDADTIVQYRSVVATMERSELACGFVGSRAALAAWPRHELFQFVNDTKPLRGSLLDIVAAPTQDEARQAAAYGAAGIYHAACHLCAFDSIQEPDSAHDMAKAILKGAFFAMQAHCAAQGIGYPRSRAELERIAESRGWNEEAAILKISRNDALLRSYAVDELCNMAILWSQRIMAAYAESSDALVIRGEREADHEQVEKLVREAFHNHYVPGCFEHYLVHLMRSHEDFVSELDLVAEKGGEVVGSIMYTKATLTDETGETKSVLSFGPIAIHPRHQRKGYGKALMERSFERARELGYDAIVILGNPANYVGSGFVSCKKCNVHLEDGSFPAALLVKELAEGALEAKDWTYRYSPVMDIDEMEAQRFDDGLEPLEKAWQPSQEEFFILANASL